MDRLRQQPFLASNVKDDNRRARGGPRPGAPSAAQACPGVHAAGRGLPGRAVYRTVGCADKRESATPS